MFQLKPNEDAQKKMETQEQQYLLRGLWKQTLYQLSKVIWIFCIGFGLIAGIAGFYEQDWTRLSNIAMITAMFCFYAALTFFVISKAIKE
jgi:hypothetical protein